jgi:hypothetical protein
MGATLGGRRHERSSDLEAAVDERGVDGQVGGLLTTGDGKGLSLTAGADARVASDSDGQDDGFTLPAELLLHEVLEDENFVVQLVNYGTFVKPLKHRREGS